MGKVSFALLRKHVVIQQKYKKITKQYDILENKLRSQDEVSEKEFNKLVTLRKKISKNQSQYIKNRAKMDCQFFEKYDAYDSCKCCFKGKLKFLAETPE